jgi:hypothetical protein
LKAANEGRKKATPTSENMSSLQQVIHLAKKMGARLGKCEVLQQKMLILIVDQELPILIPICPPPFEVFLNNMSIDWPCEMFGLQFI